MKFFNRCLSWAISKAKKSKLIQNLVEKPIAVGQLPHMGIFVDSQNHTHILYQNLREIIKPGSTNTKPVDINEAFCARKLKEACLDIESILPLLHAAGQKLENAAILEIGCDIGCFCYALAKHKPAQITGSDTVIYKSSSTNEEQQSIQKSLNNKRNIVAHIAQCNDVVFKEDDICNSALPSNTFDIVFSNDVLEHLSDPQSAFVHINRILKLGGIAIHKYNPFFAINGGHSACTLDFLWGHVRLSSDDFVKYIEQIRPQEQETAKAFYFHGLNRMSLQDMKNFSVKAGLELLGCLQIGKEQTMRMLDADIWKECSAQYSNIAMEDLFSYRVVVVQKKSTLVI